MPLKIRNWLCDRHGQYETFIILGFFLLTIIVAAYFIQVTDIMSQPEKIQEADTYGAIAEEDLADILELAYAEAARDAGKLDLTDEEFEQEFERLFVNYTRKYVEAYLGERGVFNVNINITAPAGTGEEMTVRGYESRIEGGEYNITVTWSR